MSLLPKGAPARIRRSTCMPVRSATSRAVVSRRSRPASPRPTTCACPAREGEAQRSAAAACGKFQRDLLSKGRMTVDDNSTGTPLSIHCMIAEDGLCIVVYPSPTTLCVSSSLGTWWRSTLRPGLGALAGVASSWCRCSRPALARAALCARCSCTAHRAAA